MAVLASTSCSCERSISSLRRLKDYTQSTMKSDKLNGLASMYIHRDIHINPSFVLKKFVLANRNRRANFGVVDSFRKIWNIILIFVLLFLVFWYWCCCWCNMLHPIHKCYRYERVGNFYLWKLSFISESSFFEHTLALENKISFLR